MTASADVVICGSGVAGLATACALGRLGLDVVLVDKLKRQPHIAKGEVLQPGALRILHDWNVLPELEARQAIRLDRLVARTPDGTELLAMDFGLLGGDRPWMLAHDYPTILESLGASLGPSVRWHRGVLVDDVVRDSGGRVAGVRTRDGDIRGKLVVAADGMSSRLRKLSGVTVSPIAYPHRLLSFELPAEAAATAEVSAYVTGRGLVMVYPLPGDRTRVYVQVRADELRKADAERTRHWCDELVLELPAFSALAQAFKDRLGTRQLLPVYRYRTPSLVWPGLALVGEAAHSVHPLAAQGMNTAIGDAHALATHLATSDFTRDAAVDGMLRAYEAERMSRIRDIHTMSHNAARMMTSTSRSGRMLGRRLLSGTGKSARLRYQLTYNMSGIGMRPLSKLDRIFQLGLLPDRRPQSFFTVR